MFSRRVAAIASRSCAAFVRRSLVAQSTSVRAFSTQAKVIRYHRNGPPEDVLRFETETLAEPKENEVLLKFLAAPMNPADINMIEGVYGIKPTLPAIAGNEGLAVVQQVGANVKGLSVNDWVLPAKPGFGTWRTHALAKATDVHKIANDIPPEYAASMSVNPTTAYRLLEDFVKLKAGDVVIQNASNSMVGLSVTQLCAVRDIRTINIIRNRPDIDEIVEHIKAYGGHIVVTEEYARTPAFGRLIADLPKPKLALNGAGGQSATDIAKTLDTGGTMVTYGGMSRKPVTIPTSYFIFKDINLRGFWLSRWVEEHSAEERKKMLDELFGLVRQKKLRMWLERHKMSDFDLAFKEYNQPYRKRKIVLLNDQ